jgi:hypothetical protein
VPLQFLHHITHKTKAAASITDVYIIASIRVHSCIILRFDKPSLHGMNSESASFVIFKYPRAAALTLLFDVATNAY